MMRRVFGEDVIRALATEESFSRGKVYFLNSAVSDLVRRGNVLTARVEGNKFPPYDVMITLHDSGVTETLGATGTRGVADHAAPALTSGAAPASMSSPCF